MFHVKHGQLFSLPPLPIFVSRETLDLPLPPFQFKHFPCPTAWTMYHISGYSSGSVKKISI